MTAKEDVLQALFGILTDATDSGGALEGVEVQRNADTPETIPADGLIVIRDGDPGEPQEILGFRQVWYTHAIPVEIHVQHGDRDTRETRFDALLSALGEVIEADLTLGGTVASIGYGQPEAETEPVTGSGGIKHATVTLMVDYSADSPLG